MTSRNRYLLSVMPVTHCAMTFGTFSRAMMKLKMKEVPVSSARVAVLAAVFLMMVISFFGPSVR